MKALLECCVDCTESAIAAQEGGADRLELCANLMIGGTTPDINLYHQIRTKTNLIINVLIRPRFGDFCYSDLEFQILKQDVRMFRDAGADGVVIGVLKPDGTLDKDRMSELIKEANPRGSTRKMHITLHRAFDVCANPLKVLEECKELGVNTILTAGQKNNCLDGKDLLTMLVKQSAGKVNILVGSGVNAQAIKELAPSTGATSFHMSGKVTLESPMTYRKDDVNMGLPLVSEYVIWQTSSKEIAKARQVLNNL